MSFLRKTYSVKVYNKSGATYRGEFPLLGGYTIEKNINGGVGSLVLTLARSFDNYNVDGLVNQLDHIEVWVQDTETHGKRVYNGFVDEIAADVDDQGEIVKLTCYGYTARLQMSLDWDGTNIKLTRNSNVATMMKAVIDNFRARYADPFINYTATSVDATTQSAKVQFPSFNFIDSIEVIRLQGGTNWYWYVDADNVFYYKAKPTTATHIFTFNKHFSKYHKSKTSVDLKNVFLYWNGLQPKDKNFISKRYYNAASITANWERYEISNDPTIKDATTANQLGAAFVGANKEPNIAIDFVVKDGNLTDNGYDIESIEPGQTVQVINTKDPDLYSANMTITKVILTPESAHVYAEDKSMLTAKRLEQIRRKLSNAIGSDGITSVTSSAV